MLPVRKKIIEVLTGVEKKCKEIERVWKNYYHKNNNTVLNVYRPVSTCAGLVAAVPVEQNHHNLVPLIPDWQPETGSVQPNHAPSLQFHHNTAVQLTAKGLVLLMLVAQQMGCEVGEVLGDYC